MAVKLRLMRMGKKKQPTYRIVAADARSPRNGRFIEIVGAYDPRPDPSVVRVDNERALHWLRHGAQPTDRVRKLLRISGAWDAFESGAPLPPAPSAPAAAPPQPSAAAPAAVPPAEAPAPEPPAAESEPTAPPQSAADSEPAAESGTAAESEPAAPPQSAADSEPAAESEPVAGTGPEQTVES